MKERSKDVFQPPQMECVVVEAHTKLDKGWFISKCNVINVANIRNLAVPYIH